MIIFARKLLALLSDSAMVGQLCMRIRSLVSDNRITGTKFCKSLQISHGSACTLVQSLVIVGSYEGAVSSCCLLPKSFWRLHNTDSTFLSRIEMRLEFSTVPESKRVNGLVPLWINQKNFETAFYAEKLCRNQKFMLFVYAPSDLTINFDFYLNAFSKLQERLPQSRPHY